MISLVSVLPAEGVSQVSVDKETGVLEFYAADWVGFENFEAMTRRYPDTPHTRTWIGVGTLGYVRWEDPSKHGSFKYPRSERCDCDEKDCPILGYQVLGVDTNWDERARTRRAWLLKRDQQKEKQRQANRRSREKRAAGGVP